MTRKIFGVVSGSRARVTLGNKASMVITSKLVSKDIVTTKKVAKGNDNSSVS